MKTLLYIKLLLWMFLFENCHIPPATGWMWEKKCGSEPKDSICLYGEAAEKWRGIVGEPDNTFERNDTILFIWYIPAR